MRRTRILSPILLASLPALFLGAAPAGAATLKEVSLWSLPTDNPVAHMTQDDTDKLNPGYQSGESWSDFPLTSWVEAGVTLTGENPGTACGDIYGYNGQDGDLFLISCGGSDSNILMRFDQPAYQLGFRMRQWVYHVGDGSFYDFFYGPVTVTLYSDDAWTSSLGSIALDGEYNETPLAPAETEGSFFGLLSDESFRSARIAVSASPTPDGLTAPTVDDVTFASSIPALTEQSEDDFPAGALTATCETDDTGKSSALGTSEEQFPLEPWTEAGLTITPGSFRLPEPHLYGTPAEWYPGGVLKGWSETFFDLSFDEPAIQLGVRTHEYSSGMVIEVFRDAAHSDSIGRVHLEGDDATHFYGLLAEESFQSARVAVSSSPTLDDVVYTPAPEPSLWFAHFAALGTLLVLRRRRD